MISVQIPMESDILLLKYDMFPAANLGQEYSKQNNFIFFLSAHGLGCSKNTDAGKQKSLSGDLSCLGL